MPIVAVIPEPNAAVELREVRTPELEENSALLEVELSEVCGTDVYLQKGLLQGVPYPLVPGHVSVGRLSSIRGKLFDVDGREFREGDHITFLDVHRTCNACWYCLVAKATTRCPQRKVYGITYGLDDGSVRWLGRAGLSQARHALHSTECRARVIHGRWMCLADRIACGGTWRHCIW